MLSDTKQNHVQIDDIQEYSDWLQEETDNEDSSTSDSFSDIPGDIKEKRLKHLLRMNPTASERIRKIWASRLKTKQGLALWYLRQLEEDGVGGGERSSRRQLAHTTAAILCPPPQGSAFSVPRHQAPSTTHSACLEQDVHDNLCCPTQPMHALGPQVRIDRPSEDKHTAGTTRLLPSTVETILSTLVPQAQAQLHSLSLAKDGGSGTRHPETFTHIPDIQRQSHTSIKDERSAGVAKLNAPTIGLSGPITAHPIQSQTHSVSQARDGHDIARRSTMIVQTPEVRQQKNITSSKDKHTTGAAGGPVGLRPSLALWKGGHSPSEGRHSVSSIGLHPPASDPNSRHCLQILSQTHSVSPVRDGHNNSKHSTPLACRSEVHMQMHSSRKNEHSVGAAGLHLPVPESVWPIPVNRVQSRTNLLPLMRDGRDIAGCSTALVRMPDVQQQTNITSWHEYRAGAAGSHPLASDSKNKHRFQVLPQTQSVFPVRDGHNEARRSTTLVCIPEIQQQRNITSENERSISAARLHLPTPGSALPISALQVQSQTNSILPMRDGRDNVTSKDVRSVDTARLHVPTPGTVLPRTVPRAQSQTHAVSPMRNSTRKPMIMVTEIQERAVSPGIPYDPSSFKKPRPGTPCNSGDSPTEQDLLYPSEELPESTESANDLHTNVQDARVQGHEAGDKKGYVQSCIPRKRVYEEVTNNINDRVGAVGSRTLSQHEEPTSPGTAQEDLAGVVRQEGLVRDEIERPASAVTSSSEAATRTSTSHAILNKENEPTVVDGHRNCSGAAQGETKYTTSGLQQSREGLSKDSDRRARDWRGFYPRIRTADSLTADGISTATAVSAHIRKNSQLICGPTYPRLLLRSTVTDAAPVPTQGMETQVEGSMDADLELPPRNMREVLTFMEKHEGPLENLLSIGERVKAEMRK
ncbi:uncharacterized protein FOMMEDRAFT_150760 [Fomitiporia mediterranea MF3/22]|uniref:uncharacterized protein n=1 Tax=Fomitiporia mediterranea (strain MF3/22) TaxID=694068 RepID=UPI0004409683|nr:uncharacterized protein FOMMEDRAFT_150760 [Fomitiporia mediterranea MF3/22]EJD08086.1 hypothetical protein FOMMEDRAFT_150760 [Fomitiporia mediterranea MF3/22]